MMSLQKVISNTDNYVMSITFPKVGSFAMQSDKHLLSICFVPGATLDCETKIKKRKYLSLKNLEYGVQDNLVRDGVQDGKQRTN